MATSILASATSDVRPTTPGWAASVIGRLRRDPAAILGTSLVLLMVGVSVLAPILAPYPTDEFVTRRLQPPSLQFLMGSDEMGRDVFSRVITGGRISLLVSFVAVTLACLAGVTLGLVSGFRGGWADVMIMRVMDVMMGFPVILLALVIMSLLGSSVKNVILAVAIVYTPRFARLVRGSVLAAREEVYVEAARSVGASDLRTALRHVLPNITAPITIQFTISLGWALLAEASLSFLGLGVPPTEPSWGGILHWGQIQMERAPWITVFSGLAIMLTVLGFNLLGDGLRDALDPRLKT